MAIARRKVKGFLPKPIAVQNVVEAINQTLNPTKKPEAKIMVVDDDRLVLRFVRTLLEPWGLQVTTLNNPLTFWDEIEAVTPDLLILDVQMPDIDGVELCQMIRNDSQWAWLPILFLTADRNPETIQNVFAAGADDFVSKPVVPPELITRIFNRLERTRLLREQAEIDTLTGLFNRHRSSVDLERFLRLAKQYQQPFSLSVLTLDNLVQINRNYGHRTGDQMLRRLAHVLRQELRNEDIIARWDGAEFIVGMYGINRGDNVEWLAEILESLRLVKFTTPDAQIIHATFSAGVAQYPDDGSEIKTLYQTAGITLEKAKQSGGNCVLSSNWQPFQDLPIPCWDVILLHPESEFTTNIIQALLTRGYSAYCFQNAKTALEALGGSSPSLYGRVILIGDSLPKLSGIELLKRLKKDKITQRSKIIWLSTQPNEVEQALSLGCFDYINIPCNVSAFIHRLRRALE